MTVLLVDEALTELVDDTELELELDVPCALQLQLDNTSLMLSA